MKNKKWHTYLKVISLSGLMAFIVLTSCNVRKGIQTLIGQEVQKQLLPSKTIQQNSEDCLVSFEDVKSEIKNSTLLKVDFNLIAHKSNNNVNYKAETTPNQLTPITHATYKVALYLLFQQIKTHH